MKTQFKDFINTRTSQIKEELDHIENVDTYQPKRMLVFENYWNDTFFNQFNNQSCRPFLENIGLMVGEEVAVGHRYINSKSDLQYFLKSPEGVIWDHPESFMVTYFGIHGSKKGFQLTQGLIVKKEILELCSGFTQDFPTVLYFGSCNLFKNDDEFGLDLLSSGEGIRGVIGFKELIPFNIGLLIDLFFLSSLFLFKSGDPLEKENLESIYNGVIKEFPVSKELGYTLYC
jgi:hypothetical protein